MVEVIKVYSQKVPSLRFIGKKYGDSDRVNGGFGTKWCEWFENGWFDTIKKDAGTSLDSLYEDIDATIGLMRYKEGEPFQYWIGMFLPEGTPVPDGFGYVDFPSSILGAAWLYGNENEIYGKEHICAEKLTEESYEIVPDEKGAYWFFERYVCPRFTTPDDKGNIILDIIHYVNKKEGA